MEQEKNKNLQLESKVFSNGKEKRKLSEWVWMNTNFVVKYIDRKDLYKNHSDTILEKNGKDFNEITWYNLYLPHDLKIKEVPKIVEQINTLTFWNNIPDYASLKEIQKYIREYKVHFPQCEFKYFTEFENKINKTEIKKCESSSEYMRNIQQQESNDLDENLEEIENELATKINKQFKEVFLEEGMSNISKYMTLFTPKDLNNFNEEEKKELDLTTKYIYKNEIKIRDKLQINYYKTKLSIARNNENADKEAEIQRDILQKIIYELYLYPYFNESILWWEPGQSLPQRLLKEKKLHCLWKTMIASSFLRELWIQHSFLNIPLHIALKVITKDKKEYYFDPTIASEIAEIWIQWNIGEYKKINVKGNKVGDVVIKFKEMWDIEESIRFLLLHNIATLSKDKVKSGKKGKIKILDKKLYLYNKLVNEWHNEHYNNIGNIYKQKASVMNSLWNRQKYIDNLYNGILSFEKALQKDPSYVKSSIESADAYSQLFDIYIKEKDLEHAALHWNQFNRHIWNALKYDYKRMIQYRFTGEIFHFWIAFNVIRINEILGNIDFYKDKKTRKESQNAIRNYQNVINMYRYIKNNFPGEENKYNLPYAIKEIEKKQNQLKIDLKK